MIVAESSRVTLLHLDKPLITLRLLLQTWPEYCHALCIAYRDLKAAFDNMNREALWLLVLYLGLPPKLVDLFKALSSDTLSCIHADGGNSDWFLARYISRLCYDVSVRLSVTEVHWVAVHTGNTTAAPASEVEAIIRSPTNMAAADEEVILHYASHC